MGYLRVVRWQRPAQDEVVEQQTLLTLLTTAVGVSDVACHGVHPKGGYRFSCTIDEKSFDDVIAALQDEGWMSAL